MRRFAILEQNLNETISFTGCVSDHTVAIGLCILQNLLRFTTGTRNDVVRVTISFLDETLSILTGIDHVNKVRANRGRCEGFLDLDVFNLNACAIIREEFLQLIPHNGRDFTTSRCQDGIKCRLTDNFPHDTFSCGFHQRRAIIDIENEILRVFTVIVPEHAELNVDDVLVAGQHQAFTLIDTDLRLLLAL